MTYVTNPFMQFSKRGHERDQFITHYFTRSRSPTRHPRRWRQIPGQAILVIAYTQWHVWSRGQFVTPAELRGWCRYSQTDSRDVKRGMHVRYGRGWLYWTEPLYVHNYFSVISFKYKSLFRKQVLFFTHIEPDILGAVTRIYFDEDICAGRISVLLDFCWKSSSFYVKILDWMIIPHYYHAIYQDCCEIMFSVRLYVLISGWIYWILPWISVSWTRRFGFMRVLHLKNIVWIDESTTDDFWRLHLLRLLGSALSLNRG